MTQLEKLRWFKDKITISIKLDADFVNLICVDLFDFITENPDLKKEFECHLFYLKELAENADFKKLQDSLFDTICEILKLTNIKDVEKLQEGHDNKITSRLKKDTSGFDPDLTVSELYSASLIKANYHRLGDNSYTTIGESSFLGGSVTPIFNQFKTAKELIMTLRADIFEKNNESQTKFKDLWKEYEDLWFSLYDKIKTTPDKLHFKEFRKYFHFVTQTRPVLNYEGFFKLANSSNLYKSNPDDLEDIKRCSLEVVDNLTLAESPEKTKTAIKNFRKESRGKSIENIICVRPEKNENRYKLVINGDYSVPLSFDRVKPTWDLILKIADGDTSLASGIHKTSLDYLNSNLNCKLYTKTGYSLTKILKTESGYITPAIKIGMISEKAFQQRLNKSKNST